MQQVELWGQCSRQREQCVQRPRSGKKFSALVEQQEGWSIVSEGAWEREGGGREGKVAAVGSCQMHVGGNLDFTLMLLEALEGF